MSWKSNKNPAFRNEFSERIFYQKYAHEGAQSWTELAGTLVDDVCEERGWSRINTDEHDALKNAIAEMKFLPGGRYLYYAGRPKKFFNNCFSGDTKVLTREGYKALNTFADGQQVEVFSPYSSKFELATMQSRGEQMLNTITFGNVRGKSKRTWTVKATANHRWPVFSFGVNGSSKLITDNLSVGHVVPLSDVIIKTNTQAYIHGLVYADGNVHKLKKGFGHQLRLCAAKAKYVNAFDPEEYTITYPPFANGDPVVYIKSEINLKELPDTDDIEYMASFLDGWQALDGHHGAVNQIHAISKEAIEYFVEHCSLIGCVASGEILCDNTPSNFGERKPLYRVNFAKAFKFPGFKVLSIEQHGLETVYCPYEPLFEQITIDHGIHTFNCYLLKGLEDTRQDWAELSKKSESCLATGGGIGADYSIYRPSGRLLAGTGGIASGPISKMQIINEIGRHIMQGGSRRSAIYASLNCRHGDIEQFITAKDWHNLPVGTTGLSYFDLKQQDFNFPAPLDMTNISVNYDTKWLMDYWRTGEVGDVFVKNVRQALSTGEPGFSFNFFDKENETLRNACTEVTSEDDSDV
jgi:hypothetical protein